MSGAEKNLLKCVESLHSLVSTIAVALDDGRYTPDEVKAINRAFSAYNSAHYNLLHPEKEDE